MELSDINNETDFISLRRNSFSNSDNVLDRIFSGQYINSPYTNTAKTRRTKNKYEKIVLKRVSFVLLFLILKLILAPYKSRIVYGLITNKEQQKTLGTLLLFALLLFATLIISVIHSPLNGLRKHLSAPCIIPSLPPLPISAILKGLVVCYSLDVPPGIGHFIQVEYGFGLLPVAVA